MFLSLVTERTGELADMKTVFAAAAIASLFIAQASAQQPGTLSQPRYSVRSETLVATLNYLATRPYTEVYQLIAALQEQVRYEDMAEQHRQREREAVAKAEAAAKAAGQAGGGKGASGEP